MPTEIPPHDVARIERVRETQGEFAAYLARIDAFRRLAGPTPEDRDFRRRMAAGERVLLGRSACDTGERAR